MQVVRNKRGKQFRGKGEQEDKPRGGIIVVVGRARKQERSGQRRQELNFLTDHLEGNVDTPGGTITGWPMRRGSINPLGKLSSNREIKQTKKKMLGALLRNLVKFERLERQQRQRG